MRELAAGQIIAGKYRLESLIGHGGMGSVWRARHVTLEMPVAIKFMGAHAEGDREARQRFEREAKALGTLLTPYIVRVTDHGVERSSPYLVMELLEGEDLSARLLREKRLGVPETSRILTQVARALRRAHEAGVIHRDLKPSNIFLARVDDEEIAKVLDFGVAKLAEVGALGSPHLTRTGTLLGSPGYMSPEQARGKAVDVRSDLWALAVIVFRALTGVKPFAGDSIAELVIKLCIDPRPVPTRLAPDLPPAVDRFFERAFAASPDERFQSAMEMAAAFATMLGQPAPEMSRIGSSPAIPRPPASDAAAAKPAAPKARPSAPSSAADAGPAAPSPFTMGPAGTMVLQTRRPPPPSTPGGEPSPAAVLRDLSPANVSPPAKLPSSAPPAKLPSSAPPAIVIPSAPPLSAAVREPTPMPASFGGFSPSSAEASAPPAADPSALALPEEPLRPPPIGALAGEQAPAEAGSDANDLRTPTGMRLHEPGAPVVMQPTPEPAPPAPTPPVHAPQRLELRMILFAAAGAAALAVLVGLGIAALRHKGGDAATPAPSGEAGPEIRPLPSASDSASSAPEPSAAPSAEPAASATPSASDSASSAPEPTAAPSAEPSAAPSAEPAVTPTPRPHATSHGTTTKWKPPPAPTTSSKKKPRKPGFGY